MIFSGVLRFTKKRLTCYLDHARVAQLSASAFFNSVLCKKKTDHLQDI
jgi:hypothetical protein